MDKIYKLGEICEVKSGYKQKLNNPLYWKDGTVSYYRGGEVESKTVNPSRKLTEYAVKNLKIPLTTENSLLFSAIGTVGSIFYSGKPGLAYSGTVLCLEPNLKIVNPNYLYYLLSANKEKIKQTTTGSTIPMLSINSFSSIKVSLPPLPEQNQILQKFQIVYDKIFKSEIVYNNRLLEIIKTILEYADLLFLKYRDSEIKIKDYFKLVRGKTPSTKNKEYYENGTIKWINSGVLTNLYFLTEYTLPSKLVTEKAVKECDLKYGKINSVLITRIQLDSDKIAWCQNDDIIIGDSIWNLISDNKLENATLFFALRMWINKHKRGYSHGSIIQMLRSAEIMNMKINWVSNPAHQKKFFTILDSKLAKIRDLHSQIRDLLLLKYFGKKN
ncbi:Putative Type-1 restriction enzyme (methylase) [endosymbiont DhMRE of Dentiscutata heterogama]|uniref:restriction endonuclease subunit S n=1 Tax=endosymbiont DhMRE of Dentiscutata heterogama TaxID=1609546 RepID=UPI0006356E4A|nr:restriction endonuclease subunit S [endosymbiont DhMRE of Dentiscutata heterogama]CFW92687.1 Putative Type-1 restriction enzyme (methylase) [endosymbiont DhMRE of Dentiscutata heterogama]